MNLFKFLGTGAVNGLVAHKPTLEAVLKTPKQPTAKDALALDLAQQRREQRAAKRQGKGNK